MKMLTPIGIAIDALRRNLMRSLLTMLGVIIGVAAVITLVSLGQGARASIEEEIAAAGSNLITVRAGSSFLRGIHHGAASVTTLTGEDAEAILKECPAVFQVAPAVSTGAQIIYANQNWSTSVQGTSQDFASIRNWGLTAGSFLTPQEVRSSARVAVLGSTVAEKLFGYEDPMGKIIRIKKVPFKVIGVLASKGQTSWGMDQDDVVIIPYTTSQKRIMGITHVTEILVSTSEPGEIKQATAEMTALLRQRHKIIPPQEDDFNIRTQEEIAQVRVGATNVMTLLLGSIASVSLLVGGIGIMNIMLVSVTERTREIGLRMSVGARARDILWQFLIEAFMLSAAGGLVGILIGAVTSQVLGNTFDWPTLVSGQAVVLSFGFAALVGVFFGFYPARKAAGLDPIEALRYE